MGTPFANDDFWVGGDKVSPLPRDAANYVAVYFQYDLCAVSIIALTCAHELLPTQWMKRMGDPHKMCFCDNTVCISL